jgi:serine/threonine-protein phosphatase 6 regulatory ankyrin repeat subunit B
MESLKEAASREVLNLMKTDDGHKILIKTIEKGYEGVLLTKIFSNYPNLPISSLENPLPVVHDVINIIIKRIEKYFVYEFNKLIYKLKDWDDWEKIIECFKNLGGDPNSLGMTVFPVNLLTRAHYNEDLYNKLKSHMSFDNNEAIQNIILTEIIKKLSNLYSKDKNFIKLSENKYTYYSKSKNGLAIIKEEPLDEDIEKKFSIFNIINIQDLGGNTELIDASFREQIDIVKCLVEYGADINIQNIYGETALMCALSDHRKYVDIIKYLINHGADINIQNKYGNTSLIHASQCGYSDIAEYLIEHNANVNIQNKYGNTALMYASEKGHLDIVKSIINHGANINIQDKDGKTALMHVSMEGYLDIVKYLIDHGADINIQDKYEKTALIEASLRKYADVIIYLVERGVDVNIQDKYGDTALMCATIYGYLDIIKYLIKHNANVNIQDKYGNTALMRASMDGYVDVVKCLVEHGVDVNIRDKCGDTALEMTNNPEIKKILSKKIV